MLGNCHQSKAYYRFIDNEKVNSADLIALFGGYSSHFMSDSSVILGLQYSPFVCHAPYRKGSKLAPIPLWVVETKEENPPVGEEEI
jgi:hypothetical protein